MSSSKAGAKATQHPRRARAGPSDPPSSDKKTRSFETSVIVRALLGQQMVTANTVTPGSTAAPILDECTRLYDLESVEAFSAPQPLGRLIRAEEVADTIVWLASSPTSAVTGAAPPVDGGLSAYEVIRTG